MPAAANVSSMRSARRSPVTAPPRPPARRRAGPRSRPRRATRARARWSPLPRRGSPGRPSRSTAPRGSRSRPTPPTTSRPESPPGASERSFAGRSRSAPCVTITVRTSAGSRRSPSVSQNAAQVPQPLVRNASSVGAVPAPSNASLTASPSGVTPASSGATTDSRVTEGCGPAGCGTLRRALLRRPEPAHDLGVAAQQPRDQHQQQHQQHGLDRHERDHHAPPSAGGWTTRPFRQSASCSQVRSSTFWVALQFMPGDRRGVLADHQPADHLGGPGDLGVALAVAEVVAVDTQRRLQSPLAHWQPPGNTRARDPVAVDVVADAGVGAQPVALVGGALPPAGDVRARRGSGCRRAGSHSRTPCSRPCTDPCGSSPGRSTAQAVPGRIM